MAKTRAQQNRAMRQDALREWLSEKCTAQHLVNNIVKIEELDPTSETFVNDLNKLKVANEQRLKVLNKYLPDLKAVEMEHSGSLDLSGKSDEELRQIVERGKV